MDGKTIEKRTGLFRVMRKMIVFLKKEYKKLSFYAERTNFLKDLEKLSFFTELTNDFIERTIILNERFY